VSGVVSEGVICEAKQGCCASYDKEEKSKRAWHTVPVLRYDRTVVLLSTVLEMGMEAKAANRVEGHRSKDPTLSWLASDSCSSRIRSWSMRV